MSFVKFGPIGRGPMHYAFNYQNVTLVNSRAVLRFKVDETLLTIPKESPVKTIRKEEKYVYAEAEFNSSDLLKFTCTIDQHTYIQTYKLNDTILFLCRYDPENMEIEHDSTSPVLSMTTFYDH